MKSREVKIENGKEIKYKQLFLENIRIIKYKI